MSKEKLSAEEWIRENDPDYYIRSNNQMRLMEAYAQYKTEQLQREKAELLDWILACKNEVFETGKISGRTQSAGQDLLNKHRKF